MDGTKALIVSTGIAAGLYFGLGFPGWLAGAFTVVGFLGLGGWKPTRLAYKTLPRDISVLTKLFKALQVYRRLTDKTVSDVFTEIAARQPNKVAILFEDQQWTFGRLESYSNKVANYFQDLGLKPGDTVAVFLYNCPEYLGILLGLSKIGAQASFINYNLRDRALHHCIKICEPRAIVFDSTLGGDVMNIYDMLDESMQDMLFCLGGDNPGAYRARSFNEEVERMPDNSPSRPKARSNEEWLCYIYTSGTTGLPKAVPIRNQRYMWMAIPLHILTGMREDDIIYIVLPLYHTNGGVLGAGQMLLSGNTVALRRKFSASQYWNDCIKYRCTVIQYIGEVCRYLLAQPPKPTDTQHCVRLATGNGLRAQIWEEFQRRFNIANIAEFYGATEGNASMINAVGKVGSCGYKSVVFRNALPLFLLKVDKETGEVVRGSDGLCIEVPVGETGEMVGLMKDNFFRRFDGYKNKEATSKKIVSNVFKHGDKYFRTGDLLRMDEEGYFYFTDRTGDTFRWKGENVSTNEVEGIMARVYNNQTDVIVLGVEVPGIEGKAGLAVIVGTPESAMIEALAAKLVPVLPSYAIPVFVRLTHEAQITGTFKFQKPQYRKEGFDIDQVKDPLYILDASKKAYIPLDATLYQKVINGEFRL